MVFTLKFTNMKLLLLCLVILGLAMLLLSVRVIFSRHHSFLKGHACQKRITDR